MADSVLFLCAHLGKGLAEGIEPEEGIVAESGISSGIEEYLTGAVAGSDDGITRKRLSLGDNASDRADECRASISDALKIFEELFIILLIVARLARKSC